MFHNIWLYNSFMHLLFNMAEQLPQPTTRQEPNKWCNQCNNGVRPDKMTVTGVILLLSRCHCVLVPDRVETEKYVDKYNNTSDTLRTTKRRSGRAIDNRQPEMMVRDTLVEVYMKNRLRFGKLRICCIDIRKVSYLHIRKRLAYIWNKRLWLDNMLTCPKTMTTIIGMSLYNFMGIWLPYKSPRTGLLLARIK